MPKTFRKDLLKVGTYRVNGKAVSITLDDLKAYHDTAKRMRDVGGYQPPVILEHAELLSEQGAPRSTRSGKAAKVKHQIGWLNGTELKGDRLVGLLNITDSEAARKIDEGTHRYVSPELRKAWTDGKGRDYSQVLAHVALTPKPVNSDQESFEPATALGLQLSLADYEPTDPLAASVQAVALAVADMQEAVTAIAPVAEVPPVPAPPVVEDDDEEEDETPEPKGDDSGAMAAVTKSIDALQATVNRLLDAVMTMTELKHEAETMPTDKNDTHEEMPLTFSVSDVADGAVENKPLAALIKKCGDDMPGQIKSLRRAYAPALLKALDAKAADMQFSADGDEQPLFSLTEIVALLKKSAVAGAGLDPTDASQLSADEDEHPEGDSYFDTTGGGMLDKKAADDLAAAIVPA